MKKRVAQRTRMLFSCRAINSLHAVDSTVCPLQTLHTYFWMCCVGVNTHVHATSCHQLVGVAGAPIRRSDTHTHTYAHTDTFDTHIMGRHAAIETPTHMTHRIAYECNCTGAGTMLSTLFNYCSYAHNVTSPSDQHTKWVTHAHTHTPERHYASSTRTRKDAATKRRTNRVHTLTHSHF